eukprot:3917592-Pyramimonas_sp.AAC.2
MEDASGGGAAYDQERQREARHQADGPRYAIKETVPCVTRRVGHGKHVTGPQFSEFAWPPSRGGFAFCLPPRGPSRSTCNWMHNSLSPQMMNENVEM